CFLRDSIFILIAGVLFRKKIVVHLHGGYFKTFYHKSSKLVKRYINFVFQYVSRGIVLGYCLKNLLEEILPEDRIDVVYNGIDTTPFEKINGERKDNGRFTMLFAGVLWESKGFFDLIKAVPMVTRYYPNIEVFIAGRWDDHRLKNRVNTYVRENNLQDKVKFVGVVTGEEKTRLFKSSDAFVLPTYFYLEGQPVVILEAMAAGLPVITTDRGSIKEMITHGQNGFIIPPYSPHEIAEKIAILIEDKNLRKKMGETSYRRVKERFTLDHYVDGVVEVLKKSNQRT
ncbi:MAG: glycosyltransferase family 4 protein, partial [Candidatus Zixiibacteriota bacterium]